LLGGAPKLLSPVADFVGFVDIDAGLVGGTAILEIIRHGKGGLVEGVQRLLTVGVELKHVLSLRLATARAALVAF
jgi:hypothetical protein